MFNSEPRRNFLRGGAGWIVLLGSLLLVCPAWSEMPRATFVVGHRGLVQAAPENTLAAFSACLQLRVGFEFDVRRTKDGQLVCLHDASLDRTTSGRGPLAQQTFAELRKLDAGKWFDPAFAGERVPSIPEIISLIAASPAGSLAAVDLKDAGDGLEEEVVRLADEKQVLERLVFIGLTIESPEIRARLRKANPQVSTARLAKSPDDIAAVLADANSDWVYVRFVPTREQAAEIHRAKKRVFIAGPLVAGNESKNWQAAAEAGIDAILTDYPLELAKQLRGR
jgi:glycerophosphoryl diester phosphodiesterase